MLSSSRICLIEASTELSIRLEAVIRGWIKVEEYTEREFKRLASKAENLAAKNIFQYLSDAGRRHADTLRRILDILSEDEKVAAVKNFANPNVPEEGSRTYRSSVEELYYGAKEHIDLELRMSRIYGQLSDTIKSRDASNLLHSLSEEERAHHSQLQALMRAFEDVYPSLKET